MSATRKPAPSEVGAGKMRDTQSICPRCMGTGRYQRLPGTPKTQCFLCDGTGIFEAQSGAPLQPEATQPEHEGVAHEPAPMTAAHIPLGGSVEHRLYSKAELTTLLERMARLVVEEAAATCEAMLSKRYIVADNDVRLPDDYKYPPHAIKEMLTHEKLQQLREAVERP